MADLTVKQVTIADQKPVTKTEVKKDEIQTQSSVFDNSIKTPEEQLSNIQQGFNKTVENRGWFSNIMQYVHKIGITPNNCKNDHVKDELQELSQPPVTPEKVKQAQDAVDGNETCNTITTDIGATLLAVGAGAITGGAGAAPAWGLASGAATKTLVKGTNDSDYSVKKGVYDATTGALAGYGGAKITYKAPITKGNGGGIDGGGGGGGPLD